MSPSSPLRHKPPEKVLILGSSALKIGEAGEFDLQNAFPGARAAAENFQNQARAIQHLGVPGAFQVALLHRRYDGVDNDDVCVVVFGEFRHLVDLALPEQRARARVAHLHGRHGADVEIERFSEAAGFLQP